jgi:ankyrin repeat protein
MKKALFFSLLISISFASMVFAQTGTCDINRAIFNNDLDTIKRFLDAGHDVNGRCQDKPPLLVACELFGTPLGGVKTVKVIQFLLETGADPNVQDNLGETPLTKIVKSAPYSPSTGDAVVLDVFGLLLDKGADVKIRDKQGKTALQMGLTHHNKTISDYFSAYLEREKQAAEQSKPAGVIDAARNDQKK